MRDDAVAQRNLDMFTIPLKNLGIERTAGLSVSTTSGV